MQLPRKPVIAIAGLACETSTFSPARTDLEAFHLCRDDEVFTRYSFLQKGTDLGDAADWRCTLTAYALPGGAVTRDAFETLADEIITRLLDLVQTTAIDGLWYDIHGAMCVEDMLDVEADLLRRIRKAIGPDVVVSTSMDLHGNVSHDLVHQTDLITCYRTAPHIDVRETKHRACRNLVDLLQTNRVGGRPPLPLKAWIPIPILLAGEQTSTRVEPAKHIYAAVPEVESRPGILDAAIWIGYAWADEPRNRAAVVVTGWDHTAVTTSATHLAQLFWSSHAAFDFVAPTAPLQTCLDTALHSPPEHRPFFISDSGDNPTAGGAGDVTWTLNQILTSGHFTDANGPRLIYASIPSAQAVQTATTAGLNALITTTIGAEVDDTHSPPVTITGRVHALKHGDGHARTEAVLQVGGVFVVVTARRKPYHLEKDFTELDLDPRAVDVVVVKIGYLEPELFGLARGWMMALTPGGVDQDVVRLGHVRIERPVWPFDRVWEEGPDLRARVVPFSYEGVGEG